MKNITIFSLLLLQGCVTLSGDYVLKAYDTNGNHLLENINMMAHGSGIYSMRNGICLNHPKATVIIKDIKTGKELSSESPYQCR